MPARLKTPHATCSSAFGRTSTALTSVLRRAQWHRDALDRMRQCCAPCWSCALRRAARAPRNACATRNTTNTAASVRRRAGAASALASRRCRTSAHECSRIDDRSLVAEESAAFAVRARVPRGTGAVAAWMPSAPLGPSVRQASAGETERFSRQDPKARKVGVGIRGDGSKSSRASRLFNYQLSIINYQFPTVPVSAFCAPSSCAPSFSWVQSLAQAPWRRSAVPATGR
jgi:hypothetical protein